MVGLAGSANKAVDLATSANKESTYLQEQTRGQLSWKCN